jgi:hypothetical protein
MTARANVTVQNEEAFLGGLFRDDGTVKIDRLAREPETEQGLDAPSASNNGREYERKWTELAEERSRRRRIDEQACMC